ncbi:MAG: hypothetical protein KatS3mg077_3223 [Candidatus Binatia bacterium]|nr:MAG: hypothetical protein KatS3mg077_3223 [Candidatus Binatia bacterium]
MTRGRSARVPKRIAGSAAARVQASHEPVPLAPLERVANQLRRVAEELWELAAEVESVAGSRAALPNGTSAHTPHSGPPARFRREGEYWVVAFGEQEVRLRHRLGLEYLAKLVAAPRQPWHCLDLAAGPGFRVVGREGKEGARDLRTLREHWQVLDEEIAEAERNQDLGRVNRLQQEREQLLRYMEAIRRGPASDAERARVAVHKAVRRALAAIEVAQPQLAKHLKASLRLGYNCVYIPTATDG